MFLSKKLRKIIVYERDFNNEGDQQYQISQQRTTLYCEQHFELKKKKKFFSKTFIRGNDSASPGWKNEISRFLTFIGKNGTYWELFQVHTQRKFTLNAQPYENIKIHSKTSHKIVWLGEENWSQRQHWLSVSLIGFTREKSGNQGRFQYGVSE